MERIFVVVTPVCPHYKGQKVGSKECQQCDYFFGGIVTNFVDCTRELAKEMAQNAKKETQNAIRVPKQSEKGTRKATTAKRARKKAVKRNETKKG